MKKLYFFIILMLLICNNSYSVIMPVDSLHVITSTATLTEAKQAKLPFFKRLIYNKLIKKINQQTKENKPMNGVGVVAFIIILTGLILFAILPFGARLILVAVLLIGGVIDLISFRVNRGKRNPFGQVGCALIILFLLVMLIIIAGVGIA